MTTNLQGAYDELYAIEGTTPSALRVRGASGTPSDGDVEIWVAADGRKEWGPMTGGGALADGDYGDIVVSGSGTVLTIDTNVVTDGKLRQGGACTVIGRSANSTGNVADIALNADGKLLIRRSGVVQGDTLVAGDIPSLDASKITTGTIATARLGSGTANSSTFLRGDQTWATPSAGSSTLAGDIDVNISSPANNDVLQYQTSDNKWHNEATLVAANIPNLDASKITAGSLALARGGTNADLSASGGTTKILAQDASHVVSARDLVAADIPSLDASKITTGTLAVARGGTNIGSYTTGDLLYASSSSALSALGIGGTGKVLTVSGGLPSWADITGGGGGGVLPPWIAYAADTKPSSGHTEDDEFDSSSLDAKWTASIIGSPTHNIDTTMRSHYMFQPTGNSQSIQLTQAFSPGGDTAVTARFRGSFNIAGTQVRMYLSDSNGTTLANAVAAVWGAPSGAQMVVKLLSRDSSVSTDRVTLNTNTPPEFTEIILHLQRVGNLWTVFYSSNGWSYYQIGTFSKTFTVAGIVLSLIGATSGATNQERLAIDWFRRDFVTP
jgi:hypothetical protein